MTIRDTLDIVRNPRNDPRIQELCASFIDNLTRRPEPQTPQPAARCPRTQTAARRPVRTPPATPSAPAG